MMVGHTSAPNVSNPSIRKYRPHSGFKRSDFDFGQGAILALSDQMASCSDRCAGAASNASRRVEANSMVFRISALARSEAACRLARISSSKRGRFDVQAYPTPAWGRHES